MIDAGEWELPA